MKLWALLVLAIVLLVVSLWSESFAPTPSIRSSYDADEKVRIYGMANPAYQSILRGKVDTSAITETDPARRETKIRELAGGLLTPALGEFFTQVFSPATTPITANDVDAFVNARPDSDLKEIERYVLKIYFVDQQGIGTAETSGYGAILAGLGQNLGYLKDNAPGPSGAAAAGSTGATGATGGAAATGATGASGADSGAASGATGGTSSGTTTGGTTASAATTFVPKGANALYGPAFTSFGEPAPNGNTPDSSKFTSYPQLLGGTAEKTTVLPGAGVVSGPRGAGLELPSADSLGASEKSQFFPFSRTPGDMDLIPDPYRVAQTFDLSSLSSKTEPVPFLTDFSAFQR